MAKDNLAYAAKVIRMIEEEDPKRYEILAQETGLKSEEVDDWQKASDKMYVAYDDAEGIHLQDDSFLDRKMWDFKGTSNDQYPLLLNYHPLVIYRHQVVKQADVVLAMVLLGDKFSMAQKKSNFDYYDPITTGDSSLSACIQSIAAFEVGYLDKARAYSQYAALMDLADFGGNVQDGLHIASMGGTWMALVYGLAGMRDYEGEISFKPHRPEMMEWIRIPLTVRERRLEITIDGLKGHVTYHLREGDDLSIHHFDEALILKAGASQSRPLNANSETVSATENRSQSISGQKTGS